ncbi:MAG: gliding motility-associated C-terminal domain-containing protein, partial [Sphingomonadales bacterium]
AGVDVTTCSNTPVSIGAAPNAANIYTWSPAIGLSSVNVANPVVNLPNTTGAPITQTYTVTTSLASAPGLCPTTDQIVVTIQPEYALTNSVNSCAGQYNFNGQILTQTGVYNDTLTTIFGCDSVLTLNLTIAAAPSANAGQDLNLCSGETGSLGMAAQPGLSYSWSPNTGLNASNVANPTVQLSNLNTGWPILQTYTLTVTNNTNPAACISTDQVDVTIFPAYQMIVQDTICNGGPFVYNGLSFSQSGIYTDSSTTANGCDSITTFQIAISQTPVFNINDTLICLGQQVYIVPQSTFNNSIYGWLAQNATNPVMAPSLTITPAQTINYMVTAIDPFLCNYTDNFTITVAPLPNLNLSTNQTVLCAYDTLQLAASGANAYTWNGPVTFANSNQNQSIILPVTGLYQVTGTTQNGCQNSLAVSITVNPVPQLQITPDQGICPGFSANINVSGATNYLWNNNSLTGSAGVVTPNQTTTYEVIGANLFNCLDTASTTVTVYPQPSASFTASPLILTNDNPTVSFTSLAQNAATTTWDFGDGTILESNQNQFDYTYPFVEDQTYTVTLNIESPEGCTDQHQVQIQIKGGIIYYVPNTFTPDGDALNNLFTPVFTSGFDPQSFHMTIFNRWGEPIFESFDPKGGWDGKIDIYNAPEGTYTYIIDFKTMNSEEMNRVTGHVLLLR